MGVDYKQLTKWQQDLQKLNDEQIDEFIRSCCKELAVRLLRKVVKRTPSNTGTLRKGWTAGQSASAYVNSLNISKSGNNYHIDIINPVEYASYVEYGHRQTPGRYVPALGKRLKQGWCPGRFMLTISEQEINSSTDKILQAKLNKYMKDVFKV